MAKEEEDMSDATARNVTPLETPAYTFWMLSFVLILTSSVSGQTTPSRENLDRLRPDEPPALAQDEIVSAMRRGVQHLIETRRSDGAWGGPQWTGGVDNDPVPGSFRSFDIAVTAMCLEALLDAEPTDQVEQAEQRAFQFLIKRTNRIKRAGPGDLPNVWAYCYCIQTFSKMLSRTEDSARVQVLQDAILKHMDGLKRWQSIHGGWFYYGSGMSQPINPSCSFVNAAVLVSLDRAARHGLSADASMVDRALRATKLMRKPDSSFIYSLRIPTDKTRAMQPINRPAGSLGRSQAGNLALRLWGDERITDEVISVWLDRLVTRHGWLDMGRKRPIPHESHAAVAGYFYYFGVYYGALCIEQLPQSDRPFYQRHVARLLIDRQEKDGSWFDYPLYRYHKPYGTAFALLSLDCCKED